jgi:uncharacterized protein YwqG
MSDDTTDRRELFRQAIAGAARAAASSGPLGSLDSLTGAAAGSAGREAPSRAPTPRRTATLEETLAAARVFGLEPRVDSLREAVRSSIRISPVSTHDRPPVIVGGTPHLPPGIEWPAWQGRPLSFLAQVDLGALPDGARANDSLPDRLLFFYDSAGNPSGLESGHRGAGRVLALDHEPGAPLPQDGRPAGASIETVIPRVWSARVEALGLNDAERDGWEEMRHELAERQGTGLTDAQPSSHIVHRVFGYPDYTGGDMQLTCELCANGHDVTDGQPFVHPEGPGMEERADRWELLAQFSADDKLGWSWGPPARRLYFWIDRDALRAGDLAEAWTIAR